MIAAMGNGGESGDVTQRGLSLTDRELFERLGWFTQVRWAFGGLCLVVLLISWYVIGLRLRTGDGLHTMAPAVHVVLLLFLYNAAFTFLGRVVRARQRVTRRLIVYLALAQIFCDVIAISFLIHFTGGVENFFVVLILVPIVIVTELLPQRLAYATAAVAVGFLNLLAWGEQSGIIPHVAVELAGRQHAAGAGRYADPLYVLHVTAAMTVTIFAMVFVASTIASRLRLREAELEQAYDRLHEADEAKSFFMRKAGHEMRAPLSAIHSILDAILQTPDATAGERGRLIGRAKHRARAMIELVNDLVKFSRLRSPHDILNIRRVCLGDVVSNTAELLRKQAELAGVDLTCQADRIWVRGDEELLRELVTNLLANAIQYTPRGGAIDVRMVRRGESAVLTVSDTGIGITDKALEEIFQEFYRAQEAKQLFPSGTGLGLAIVRRIVEIHHGSVRAERRPEGGSIFRVWLPLSGQGPGQGL